jgi:hypothetical protein
MTTKNLVATIMAAVLSVLLLTGGKIANTQADAKSVTSEATQSKISSPSNFGEHHFARIDRVIVKQHVIKKTIVKHVTVVKKKVKKVHKSVKTYKTSASLQSIMKCIANRESHNSPTARRSDGGTASGLFGFIDGTWNNYGGYAHAWQAPRAVQVEKFYKSWAYWKSRYHGAERMNPWYYAGHKQCW